MKALHLTTKLHFLKRHLACHSSYKAAHWYSAFYRN